MSSIRDPEMVGLFLDELEEQLQMLEESILSLEQQGEEPEVIQTVFRVAHTLKGSSAVMGFEEMKNLTHEMENILDKIRNNTMHIDRELINLLFQCLDMLRALKSDFVTDREHIATDTSEMVELLRQRLDPNLHNYKTEGLASGAKPDEGALQVAPKINLTEDQRQQIVEALASGFKTYYCRLTLVPDSFLKVARACMAMNYFNEQGVVVATDPNLLTLEEAEDNHFGYLIISFMPMEDLEAALYRDLLELEKVEIVPYEAWESEFLEDASEVDQGVKEDRSEKDIDNILTKIEEEKPISKPLIKESLEKDTTKEGAKDSGGKVTQTVRVDVERLEKMMNLVGELVIEQTRIALVGNTLYNRYPSDVAVDDLLGISNHISRVISELQEGVMKARMLPIQQLFNRFPRMVRDLTQTLKKDINLVIEGGETEMDRSIIEDITDPLIHLLRNALDHGIETSEARVAAGKPEKGNLYIRAYHQENHVFISVEDDGGGINPEKIKRSAVEKKLISPSEAESLTDYQAIQLIFANGFSTAEVISDVSGRGVGMDIVRSHIDKLNGLIDVTSTVGVGTQFKIKLPLTLAILTGLLVKIGEEIYALPMNNVLEIVRKPESEVETIKGQEIVVIRERVLPLIWLHDHFGIPRRKDRNNVFIIILGVAEKRIGLVVDELLGNQEIVVKPLGSYIGKVEGYSGATILGDGSVACILDVVGIAKMANSQRSSELEY